MHKILHLIAKFSDGTTAPEWMLLFAAGWGELATGERYWVDREAFDLILANIASRGNEVVFDYEHASVLGKQAAPASGWIKELTWEEGLGIRARVEWTEQAAAFIAKKEYRYFSPVFFVRKSDGRVCGLDSVALTNRPRTTNLTPILAKLEWENNEETIMDRKQLIAALGLKEDATDVDIIQAVATLGIKLPEAKETIKEVVPTAVIAALGLKESDDVSTIVAHIHAKNQAGTGAVSRDEFLKLQASLAERDASDAVTAAMKAGKIAPAQEDWATNYAKMDLKGFNTFVAMAPVVVPVNQLPGYTPSTDTTVNTEAVAHVASLMGVDPADIKKYGEDKK